MSPETDLGTPQDEERLTRVRLLLRALTCVLLVLAVLRPPEIYTWSGAVCKILLAAAAGLVWLQAEGVPLLPGWTAGLLPLAVAAVAGSSCRARALDEASQALTLILAAFLGRALARDKRGRDALAFTLVTLGSVAAVLAVLQHHVTYREELRSLLTAAGPSSPYVIARLLAGRPSGPFSLPAALGGFLALTLPLTLVRARSGAEASQRGAAVAAALLQTYALLLTRSVGGLVVAAVSLLVSLPVIAPRRRGILLAALPLAAIGIGFLFLHERRAEVGAPGADPLSLRAGNWRAAAGMIRDHALFGTGPGSFGTFYPRYMRPGMNETRYAHNSYLQAVSSWGLWAVVPLAGLLVAFATRLQHTWRRGGDDLPFVSGGAAFLAHNLVDFTAFLPGVAIPASILIGVGLGDGVGAATRAEDAASLARAELATGRGRARVFARGALPVAAALVVFLGQALLASRAGSLIEQARSAAAEGSTEDALQFAQRAARVRPDDPLPRGFIAEWVLRHGMNDPALRREGERQARTALRLDPESAILHYNLSLYHLAAHDMAPAYREQQIAHLLFPLKEAYQLPQTQPLERGDP